MAASDSKAPIRMVKRVQFGILPPDEIVSSERNKKKNKNDIQLENENKNNIKFI
jgi:hypothetical protein